MRHYAAERVLLYTAGELYDLVADVERYPEFLPWWLGARVRRRDGDTRQVDQLLGLGPLRWRFSSTAAGRRPDWLRITSDARPFRRLDIRWDFEAESEVRCTVKFQTRYAFRSALWDRLFHSMLDEAIGKTLDAFGDRAQRLYGLPQAR